MALLLGDTFPDFEAESTTGTIKLHEYLGSSWGLICSHPADFTPVCTTELGACSKLSANGEFSKRDVKMLSISCDPMDSHKDWANDIKAASGFEPDFPLIADPDRIVATKLGMLHGDTHFATSMPVTVRTVFIIGPDKKLKLSMTYPPSTGRNFDEILRVIDSMQLTASKGVATPEGWSDGKECLLFPGVSAEEAAKKYPECKTIELPSGKAYLRVTPVPPDS